MLKLCSACAETEETILCVDEPLGLINAGADLTWDNPLIRIFILIPRHFVDLHVAAALNVFRAHHQIQIMSFITNKAKTLTSSLKIPSRLSFLNALAGADPNQPESEDPTKYLKGWLYSKKYRTLEYAPEKLTDVNRKHFFEHCQKVITNDCLVHAVNFALKYPWFVQREQVIRLV